MSLKPRNRKQTFFVFLSTPAPVLVVVRHHSTMRWPLVTSTIALSASLTFCDAYRHGITYAATSSLPPSALPFNKLTHIDFTGFTVASDGALASPNVQVVEKLVDSAHAANVNVSIVIQAQGGSANLRAFFGDAGKREKLANEIAAAVSSRTFDGVQLHWEAPGRLVR